MSDFAIPVSEVLRRKRTALDAIVARAVAAQQEKTEAVRAFTARMHRATHDDCAALIAELRALDDLITTTEEARRRADTERTMP